MYFLVRLFQGDPWDTICTHSCIVHIHVCLSAVLNTQSVQLAVALNWQMFCGCIAAANPAPGAFDPLVYNATFASAFAGVKQYALPYVPAFKACSASNIVAYTHTHTHKHTKADTRWVCLRQMGVAARASCKGNLMQVLPGSTHTCLPACLLQGLLEDGDYVGVSGYGSGYPTSTAVLSWRDIERPLQTLAYELGLFGISLKALTQRRPILYVEQVRQWWCPMMAGRWTCCPDELCACACCS